MHAELAGDVEELEQHARHRNVGRVLAEDRLADRAQRLGEFVHRMVRRHIAGLKMNFRHPLVIAF
ncbi:hypothetical protein D3C83_166120 [compost metagenome]